MVIRGGGSAHLVVSTFSIKLEERLSFERDRDEDRKCEDRDSMKSISQENGKVGLPEKL